MKRKKSTVPTRVYQYELLAPTKEAEATERAFVGARIHYNKLVTIERIRRQKFRDLRSAMFPELASLEASVKKLDGAARDRAGSRQEFEVRRAVARRRSGGRGRGEKAPR